MPLNTIAPNHHRPLLPVAQPDAAHPHEVAFRLPLPNRPRVVYRGSYSYDRGALWCQGRAVLQLTRREHLRRGVTGQLRTGHQLVLGLSKNGRLTLHCDGVEALRENELRAPISRSAKLHGLIGLAASAAGFLAGYLYLQKAAALDSAWALKMGYHTAAWHALLTVALFPASVFGQRVGIRAAQIVSAVFLFIHFGIAVANALWPDAASPNDGLIALLNAISGVFFLASVIYGQRAYRDMDPLRAAA